MNTYPVGPFTTNREELDYLAALDRAADAARTLDAATAVRDRAANASRAISDDIAATEREHPTWRLSAKSPVPSLEERYFGVVDAFASVPLEAAVHLTEIAVNIHDWVARLSDPGQPDVRTDAVNVVFHALRVAELPELESHRSSVVTLTHLLPSAMRGAQLLGCGTAEQRFWIGVLTRIYELSKAGGPDV